MSLKVCPGFGLDLPHEAKTTDDFRLGGNGKPKSPYCTTHEAEYNRQRWSAGVGSQRVRERDRATDGRGVYLGVIKLADRSYLTKPGKSRQMRSKAGRLASGAKTVGFDVVNAEILYVIDIPDADNRSAAEAILLGLAEPTHGNEYFRGIDFPKFAKVFEAIGRPYTVRDTYTKRNAEFRAWLAQELAKVPA